MTRCVEDPLAVWHFDGRAPPSREEPGDNDRGDGAGRAERQFHAFEDRARRAVLAAPTDMLGGASVIANILHSDKYRVHFGDYPITTGLRKTAATMWFAGAPETAREGPIKADVRQREVAVARGKLASSQHSNIWRI
jgi:hypothetical protein